MMKQNKSISKGLPVRLQVKADGFVPVARDCG